MTEVADLWPRLLSRIAAGEALSADESAEAMRTIMRGDATQGQIGGFLMALRTRGETVDELDGLARTALEFANAVDAPGAVIDTCGDLHLLLDAFSLKTATPACFAWR